MNPLPQTGTGALLEVLSAHLDDDFVNSLFALRRGRGRRPLFSPNQLFRVLLLSLLTPARSFNLLVKLLAENHSWRAFAFLRSKRVLPDVRMLHEFRDALDLAKMRAINGHLLAPFLESWDFRRKSIAIIDSTDLPAATHSFKKKRKATTLPGARLSALERSRVDKANGSSAIKSTPCVCGCRSEMTPSCWCHWSVG